MIHSILRNTKVVLASESPRRKLLLEMLGLKALVVPAGIAEPLTDERPYKQAMEHARAKAGVIRKVMSPDSLIIGADTIVAVDGRVLGKPESSQEAEEFLHLLSGRAHSVYTGICLILGDDLRVAYERSKVHFYPLSRSEIADYIKTGEPFDKAGGYGIQGYGAQFIHRIQGCYFNVMGFPIHMFYKLLQEMLSDA